MFVERHQIGTDVDRMRRVVCWHVSFRCPAGEEAFDIVYMDVYNGQRQIQKITVLPLGSEKSADELSACQYPLNYMTAGISLQTMSSQSSSQ